MVQFIPLDPDIEVNASTIWSFIDGLGAFKNMALQMLKRSGIPENIKPDPNI